MKRGIVAVWIVVCFVFPAMLSNAETGQSLIEAAAYGDAEKVRQLVAAGLDVNTPDEKGCPPIILAARSGDVDTLRILLSSGADVDARDMYEMTPLMHAALSGNTDAVRFLVSRGADVHARAMNGKTAVDWATNKNIAQILKNHDRQNGRQ